MLDADITPKTPVPRSMRPAIRTVFAWEMDVVTSMVSACMVATALDMMVMEQPVVEMAEATTPGGLTGRGVIVKLAAVRSDTKL